MACGICVIGSDAGGTPDILNDSTGYIFESNNAMDLLDKINIALSDIETCRKKGLVAEKIVRENFSMENTCIKYLELYSEILGFKNPKYNKVKQEKACRTSFI